MRSANAPLEQRPEVLQAVRMDHFVFQVGLRMVNKIMHERLTKLTIGLPRITVDRASRFNVCMNQSVERFALDVRQHLRPHLAMLVAIAPLKQSGYGSFCMSAARLDDLLSLGLVHV